MARSRRTTAANKAGTAPPPGSAAEAATDATLPSLSDWQAYGLDALQRTFLTLDTLRERGNVYAQHEREGAPPLLKFEHELIMDGSSLKRPCNYSLVRIIPPAGTLTRPEARPVVVVDPRAGHGPGIGGFKLDSEVGVALKAGHAVYFVTFRPEPEPGQTLEDVLAAEACFMDVVAARHTQCSARPLVIGNCQAGWAIACMAARHPGKTGPLVLVGAPLSYWAGSSTMNPMRYTGAALGGAWMSAMAADMGAGKFDGAHLVRNFENLNPGNTWFGKTFRLWQHIDREGPRFVEFERWWGGFFRMNGAEIEAIVENLFVGNRLARGEARLAKDAPCINLRDIEAPVVVFASHGDNITPPPQALNWILDTWGDERALVEAGRTIVYVLHESVGHLGIFVGADVARKEHDQIVNSLDVIEHLPPGLYEMQLVPKAGLEKRRWDHLEPGDYTVQFCHRTMADLRALNPEGREEEALFSTLNQISALNLAAYRTFVSPWVRAMLPPVVAEQLTQLHPLRLQRKLLSDRHPWAAWVRAAADWSRAQRNPLPAHHPLRKAEDDFARRSLKSFDQFRDQRDASLREWARCVYGPAGLGRLFPPGESDENRALAAAERVLDRGRKEVLLKVSDGGHAEAVCRIVLAGMKSLGAFERRSLRLARLLAEAPGQTAGKLPRGQLSAAAWQRLMREQARIVALAPAESLNALGDMLPTPAEREAALAVAAAVLMIEPTLTDPASEVIEYLIHLLGVDPLRVIQLARTLTDAHPSPQAVTVVASAKGRRKVSPLELPATRRMPLARTRPRAPTPGTLLH